MKKLVLLLLLSVAPALAQESGAMGGMDMSMQGASHETMTMHSPFGGYAMNRDSSGTSWQPELGPAMGRVDMIGPWMLMSRAELIGGYDYQSGPRGDRMPFLCGMVMGMAQRDFGDGTLGLRAMLSPDPFMGRRGYPLLEASGETADGSTPLIDR